METMFNMGLRAISEVVLKVVVFATACRACSCRISVYGWTMLYKWGHAVITLPEGDEENYTSHSQNDGNSANQHSLRLNLRTYL
eukprot:6176784-Pleurochrysis_carterae.AAC.1